MAGLKRTPLTVTLTVLIFFLLLAAGALAATAYAYKDRFYPGVQVGSIDLSGKTEAEGKALIESQAKSYLEHPFVIVAPDISKPLETSPNQYENLEIPVTAKTLGVVFQTDQASNAAWAIGHGSYKTWISEVVKAAFVGMRQPFSYQVDNTAIQTFIDTEIVPKIGLPTPAKMVVKGDQVIVEAPKSGFELNKDKLRASIITSLENSTDNDTTYLQAPVEVAESPITVAKVQPVADRWNQLASVSYSFTADGINLKPAKKDTITWFAPVQDDKGAVTLAVQDEAVSQYLAKQKNLNQQKSLDAALSKLKALASQEVVQKTPLTVALVAKPAAVNPDTNFTPGKFEGKYVEVNLKTQRMYLVIGNELIKSYVVSSGAWSTPTPTGTYTINGKIKRAYSAAYGLYMPYWQNFLGGEYGIHELPEWPNGYKEGASHLGIPVSHGCIRLGVGAAEEVYNWTENGTPIYIH